MAMMIKQVLNHEMICTLRRKENILNEKDLQY